MVNEQSDSQSTVVGSGDTTRSEKVVLNCFREMMKKLIRCCRKKPENKSVK